jgi:hypothetical protein
MIELKPIGQERVNYNLQKALLQIEKLNALKTKTPTPSIEKKIDSLNKRISLTRKKLVFLSTKARDKVTKFYASNALKEIAQKLRE